MIHKLKYDGAGNYVGERQTAGVLTLVAHRKRTLRPLEPSLRGAQRRSNPAGEGLSTGSSPGLDVDCPGGRNDGDDRPKRQLR